jgi:hypothetical protein
MWQLNPDHPIRDSVGRSVGVDQTLAESKNGFARRI